MKETIFKIGELVMYPVYEMSGGETGLEPGLVVEKGEEELDVNRNATVYRVMGNSTIDEGWYYSWELLKIR